MVFIQDSAELITESRASSTAHRHAPEVHDHEFFEICGAPCRCAALCSLTVVHELHCLDGSVFHTMFLVHTVHFIHCPSS